MTPGEANYREFHFRMHGYRSGAFKLLSEHQKKAWEAAAMDVINKALTGQINIPAAPVESHVAAHVSYSGSADATPTAE